MRPSLLIETLHARMTSHVKGDVIRPTNIVGIPGIGKTQIVKQAADAIGIGFMTVHGPLMLAEDFGMPRFEGNEIVFATPGGKFPFVDTDCPETGALVIDELAQMDVPQQKIMANMFQERELHGRKLKPGWHIVATGNRQQDRAGANRILSHLNDRITTYDLDVSHEDWIVWAAQHGVRPEVMAYINWRPDMLSKFDPAHDKNPSPRSWAEGVSRAIDTVPKAAEYETYKGDVGEGAAAEFKGFMETFRALPNPDLVLSDPQRAVVPTELSVIYALCGALAHRARPDNMDAIVDYAERLPPEFMVLLIRDTCRMNTANQDTKAFVRWATGKGAETLM